MSSAVGRGGRIGTGIRPPPRPGIMAVRGAAANGRRRAAEIMLTVYSRLLAKMERDSFQVLAKRYRLSRLQKIAIVLQVLISSRLKR